MKVRFASLAPALLAFATAAIAPASRGQSSPSDQQAIAQVARSLRSSILHHDLAGIAALVSVRDGLICTDTTYRKAKVVSDLHNHRSHLYMSLFDGPRFSKACGRWYTRQFPATSDLAFFTAAPNGKFEIAWGPEGFASVKFFALAPNLYPREYDLRKEAGHWRLTGGFIVGECGCG